jgi:hypothetical protein
MSTAEDRLAVIEANYKDALEKEPHDLARATTAAEVTSIQANVAAARETYFTAIAAALTKDGASVESAFAAAKTAKKSVDDARDQAAAIPVLLGKLTASTQAATGLLKAAKA